MRSDSYMIDNQGTGQDLTVPKVEVKVDIMLISSTTFELYYPVTRIS